MDQRCWDLAKVFIEDNKSSDTELDKARIRELGQIIQDAIDDYIQGLD
jgi:hypothetical protein